jgi:type II secretory ATPase GspE/PulE/Tfp pilus assembly ATPase PilB-like protein
LFQAVVRIRRILTIVVLLFLVCALDAAVAYAQAEPVPTAPVPAAGVSQQSRGPGFYFSIWKLGLYMALFWLWVKTTDWVSQDGYRVGTRYAIWNPIVAFSFPAAMLLFFLIPWFWVGYVLMVLAYVGPLTAYIIQRNSQLEYHQKVMTAPHLRHLVADLLGKMGVKIAAEKQAEADKGPPVKLVPMGGKDEPADQANLLLARQSPGFVTAKELIADVLDHRGGAAMLEYSAAGAGVKYQIDGVWHDMPPRERANADPLLAVLKKLAARNENERRAKQDGKFGAEYKGTKYDVRILSQGVESGERAVVSLDDKKFSFKSFAELGMREKLVEQVKELIGRPQGFVLFSALPGQGLSTLFDVALRESDRYMRDYAEILDARKPEREIENVQVHKFDSAAGETPMKVLPAIIRTYPNAFAIRDLVDAQTVKTLIEQVPEERLVLASVKAKEAVEALLRVLLLKVSAKEFAPVVAGVVNMRLARRLCDECKQAYAPPAEVLKQLGAKIEALYRPPQPIPGEKPKPPCEKCAGVGYYGRTGIFEVLVVDDAVRKTLITNPKLDALRLAARKAGMRTLQEEGILLAAKGVTSLPELMRVLKQ